MFGKNNRQIGGLESQNGLRLSPYGFAGEEQTEETGHLFLRARTYNPETGRFLQQDPLSGHISQPQTLHRYTYAFNNPINHLDPSGLMPPRQNRILYQPNDFNFLEKGAPRSVNGSAGQKWQTFSDPYARQQSQGHRPNLCGLGGLLSNMLGKIKHGSLISSIIDLTTFLPSPLQSLLSQESFWWAVASVVVVGGLALIPGAAVAVLSGAVVGAIAGGGLYALTHPGEELLRSDGFYRAMSIGAMLGAVGGVLSYFNTAVPLYAVTGGLTNATGNFVGQVINQVLVAGKSDNFSINWTDVTIAGAVGVVVGSLTPLIATTPLRAALLGGAGNGTQYLWSQTANGRPVSYLDALISIGAGALVGRATGVATSIDDLAYSSSMKGVNYQLQVAQIRDLTLFGIGRTFAGAITTNTDMRRVLGIPDPFEDLTPFEELFRVILKNGI